MNDFRIKTTLLTLICLLLVSAGCAEPELLAEKELPSSRLVWKLREDAKSLTRDELEAFVDGLPDSNMLKYRASLFTKAQDFDWVTGYKWVLVDMPAEEAVDFLRAQGLHESLEPFDRGNGPLPGRWEAIPSKAALKKCGFTDDAELSLEINEAGDQTLLVFLVSSIKTREKARDESLSGSAPTKTGRSCRNPPSAPLWGPRRASRRSASRRPCGNRC